MGTNNVDGLEKSEVECLMSSSRAVYGNEPKKGLHAYVGVSAEDTHAHIYTHKVWAKFEEEHG